jgi:hypothetical protein
MPLDIDQEEVWNHYFNGPDRSGCCLSTRHKQDGEIESQACGGFMAMTHK